MDACEQSDWKANLLPDGGDDEAYGIPDCCEGVLTAEDGLYGTVVYQSPCSTIALRTSANTSNISGEHWMTLPNCCAAGRTTVFQVHRRRSERPENILV